MNIFTLKIVTPEGIGFEGDVTSFTVRTIDGEIGILAGHTDYFAATELSACKITLSDGKFFKALCGGGFLRVGGNIAVLITEMFEKDSDIDPNEAEKSLLEAKERLSSSKGERESYILKKAVLRASIRSEIAVKK